MPDELRAIIKPLLPRHAPSPKGGRPRLGDRLAGLTAKEREVLGLVAAGRTNREMAEALGLSLRAVDDRRARLMRKVGAGSVAELVA